MRLEAAALAVRAADLAARQQPAPGVGHPGDGEHEDDRRGDRRLTRGEGVQPEQEQVEDDDRGDDRPPRRPQLVAPPSGAVLVSPPAAAALTAAPLAATALPFRLLLRCLRLVHDTPSLGGGDRSADGGQPETGHSLNDGRRGAAQAKVVTLCRLCRSNSTTWPARRPVLMTVVQSRTIRYVPSPSRTTPMIRTAVIGCLATPRIP